MDFNDTPEEARFREEASAWLAENAPTDDAFRALSPLEQAKVWQKRKYDAGWACIGWAPEFGGRGASAIEEVIWRQEESQYDLPANFFLIGQGMIGPTLMAWASDQDKATLPHEAPVKDFRKAWMRRSAYAVRGGGKARFVLREVCICMVSQTRWLSCYNTR